MVQPCEFIFIKACYHFMIICNTHEAQIRCFGVSLNFEVCAWFLGPTLEVEYPTESWGCGLCILLVWPSTSQLTIPDGEEERHLDWLFLLPSDSYSHPNPLIPPSQNIAGCSSRNGLLGLTLNPLYPFLGSAKQCATRGLELMGLPWNLDQFFLQDWLQLRDRN